MVTTNQSELFRNVPPCRHYGAVRSFELQLLPSLVGKLKEAKNKETQLTHRENEPSSQDFEKNGTKGSGEIHSEGPNHLGNRMMFYQTFCFNISLTEHARPSHCFLCESIQQL